MFRKPSGVKNFDAGEEIAPRENSGTWVAWEPANKIVTLNIYLKGDSMKKMGFSAIAVLSLTLLQGCWGYYYGGGHHWHHHHGWGYSMNSADSAKLLAQDYGISPASAQAVVDLTRSKDQAGALAKMGVGVEDMTALAKLEMPSEEGIQKMADTVGEDSSKIEKVLSGFISDARAEKGE